ncbi:MAG: hypothetical protein M3A44_05130 [Gammaproteobacteria bacterium]
MKLTLVWCGLREEIGAINRGNLPYVGLITFAVLLAGCAVPRGGVLIPPVGYTDEQPINDRIECSHWASKLAMAKLPLTDQENMRVNGVETGRFSEGGRGRSLYSDRQFLCMLDRDYQYVDYPANWLPESRCEALKSYKSGGIDEKRLRYMCEKSPENHKCDVCQTR